MSNLKLSTYWDVENRRYKETKPRYSDYAFARRFDKINVKGKKVLDIGCGMGDLMTYCKKREAYIYGIDISKDSVNYCKKKGLNVIIGDCRNLPFKNNSFDIVYSVGVVEHFKETHQAIEEHIRVTKEKAIILVPNILSPYFPITFIYHLLRGTIFKGYVRVSGKSYIRGYLKRRYRCKVEAFYISACLKELTKKFDKKLAEKLESNFMNKYFGHLLWMEIDKSKF